MALFEKNPFVTKGYAGEAYFCDRKKETEDILRFLVNGNNVALISPRRIGKTDLLHHCFSQQEIKENCYTFIIDIYNTSSLRDFVNAFAMAILAELKPKGRKVWEGFLNILSSVRQEISFDINGLPVWGASLGAIRNPELTLDEIFLYIRTADKPCFIAIDEFQQITRYSKEEAWKVEASLRTYIQQCPNGTFIFSGSQRHLMTQIFLSPSRPFYQQTTIMGLHPIPVEKYMEFAREKFENGGKNISDDVVPILFDRFESVTAYIQRVMNVLYDMTSKGVTCTPDMIDNAIEKVLDLAGDAYESLIYQMPEKQRSVFLAIASEGKAKEISGGAFIRKHHLQSPSSVISATKGLLEKDFITEERGTYWVYDHFFVLWLRHRGMIR